jgi:hypothetical protein
MAFYGGAVYALLGPAVWYPLAIARWTKCGGWEVIGSLRSANPDIQAAGLSLCVGGGHYLYVGGQFDWVDSLSGNVSSSVAANNVAKFDLLTGVWSPVGDASLTRPAVALAASSSGEVYAGFPPWSESPGVLSTELLKVCTANTWSGLGGGLIESTAARDPYGVSALAFNGAGTKLYAAGDFDGSATVTSFNVIKWDGSWHSMETANNWTYSFGPWMEWVAADRENVFVAGSFAGADSVSAPAGIARFATTGTPIPIERLLLQLAAGFGRAVVIKPDNSTVFVTGTFDSVETMPANSIAIWDGSGWSTLGSGLTFNDGSLATGTGLAADSAAVYVAGNFERAGGVPAQGIARWVTGANPDTIIDCNVTVSSVGLDHCNVSVTVTGQTGSHWWVSNQTSGAVVGEVTLWNGSATIIDPNGCNGSYIATNLCCHGPH